jgi:site-specific DNA recombinase
MMTTIPRSHRQLKTFRCAAYVSSKTASSAESPAGDLALQRQAIEQLIATRKRQGWICLPETYEDNGPRDNKPPGIERLLADVQAGKIDCVVTPRYLQIVSRGINRARVYGILRRHGVTVMSVWPEFIELWGDKLEDGWLADPPF